MYPGYLHSDATKICASIENNCLDIPKFASVATEFYKKVLENGHYFSWFPNANPATCCACNCNGSVIQPDGYQCRCWNQVGQKEESYASIVDKSYFEGKNYYKWINYDPFDVEECKNCKYFTLCRAGCPAKRVPASTDYMDTKRMNHCSALKYNIKDMLLLVYKNFEEEKKKNQNCDNKCQACKTEV